MIEFIIDYIFTCDKCGRVVLIKNKKNISEATNDIRKREWDAEVVSILGKCDHTDKIVKTLCSSCKKGRKFNE